MPTGIVIDGKVHFAHPESTDNDCFCGRKWSHEDATRVLSGAYYVEHIAQKLSTEEEVPICTDCIEDGEEWAAPDDA